MKVLILDDEEGILNLQKEILKQEGIEAFTFLTGKDALEACKSNVFDACITDYTMPTGNGIDFLRELRKQGYDFHVIFCSAYLNEEIKKEARTLGVVDFIDKPFQMDDIFSALCVDKF